MSIAYARDYAWLQESQPDLAEAYCLSYVRGLSRPEALRRFGADERALRSLPIVEAVEACLCAEEDLPLTVHALSLGEWTVIVEPTGCSCTRPQVYRKLSVGTELVCVRVVMGYRYEFRWVVDGALRRFGADERALRSLPIVEAVEACLCAEEEPPLTVHALSLGEWTVIVEPTGCSCTWPQVYRRLSVGTELVCVRVVMGYRYEFRWVVDGVLRFFFDARLPDQRGGSDPDRLAADLLALGLTEPAEPGRADPGPALLALADRVTGVRLRPEHLSGPLLGAELDAPAPAAAR